MTKQDVTLPSWVLDALQQSKTFFEGLHQPTYLVGGSVRNLLLHEPCVDWDVVTAGDTRLIARQLADTLGGFYAPLHERANRIVVKHTQGDLIIDVSPLQGATLEEDLLARDFTLNALAAPFGAVIDILTADADADAQSSQLQLSDIVIDPLSGSTDLAAQILRATSATIFQRDPLRMLRAARFVIAYHFTLAPATEQLIKHSAPLLLTVAPERIREELYAILQFEDATAHLRLLDQLQLFSVLFPELDPARGMLQPSLHHWDVFDHSLETVSMLEKLAATLQQAPTEIQASPLEIGGQGDILAIKQLLTEAEQQGFFSFALLTSPQMKLATLLHDGGKASTHAVDAEGHITFYHHPQAGVPVAQQIARRLSLSMHDNRLLQQVAANHMRPGQLSQAPITPRAVRRFFVDMGPRGLYVALISLADHLSMRGPDPLTVHWERHRATVRLLLTRYIRERESIIPPRLVQAEELMRRLQLEPGPLVGQLLEAISEAQAEGALHSKYEVIWFAEEKLQQLRPVREKQEHLY
jgi:tRNA nucleotidyltransferase/poly(A) polymerase